jgi:DNA ligase 1
MHAFATLLERLVLTPSRNAKLALLVAYFKATPDPDRGYALAAITSNLDTGTVKAAALRTLAAERIDSELFALSYDYVGDLAETIALIWQSQATSQENSPSLGEVVDVLKSSSKTEALKRVTHWLILATNQSKRSKRFGTRKRRLISRYLRGSKERLTGPPAMWQRHSGR